MSPAPDLDPVIHTQARLRIMTTLTALPPGDRITFPRLQGLLDATAGNLSTHLRRLEDAGYVAVTKGHIGRVPATHVEATRAGRRAFEDYVAQLAALLTPPPGTAAPDDAGPAAPAPGRAHDDAGTAAPARATVRGAVPEESR
jgi:DNA-binding MarR family transcriptional regulator